MTEKETMPESATVSLSVLDYEHATQEAEQYPHLLPTIISERWEMELERGVINFDPRDPESHKKVAMGSYAKRIIPDRTRPDSEIFSSATVPIYLPFEHKYPSNFDFTMAKAGQKLLSLTVESNTFDIFASSSPLAVVPHALLVPAEQRPQFLQNADIDAVAKLRTEYPMFHFIYSSMGAGAGVNHQHWHLMAGQEDYPILSHPIENIYESENTKIGEYPSLPTDCLVIENVNGQDMSVEKSFVSFMQQNDIPHNLFVSGKRTWITPRSRYETGMIPGKRYGAWDTILGVCNTTTKEQYDNVNEVVFGRALEAIQLQPSDRDRVIEKLISLA